MLQERRVFMININLLKKRIGYYDYKKSNMSIDRAIKKVDEKFNEISKALNINKDLIFNSDQNGLPFVGQNPSVLFAKESENLKKIKPIDLPVTFFVTGDAINTSNISEINKLFKSFEGMGMPNSHKFAQSLICKTIIDKPAYINNHPLIPIGIDNYIFVSPEDVVKRLQVIRMYKKAVEQKIPMSQKKSLRNSINNNFNKEIRKLVKFNKDIVYEFARIFPNSLKAMFTNEPPSSITHISSILNRGKPLAVVQMEYATHPAYFDFFKDYYYLYMSNDSFNKGLNFPNNSRKNIFVGCLPVSNYFLNIKKPLISRIKRIILSSGGSGGRTFKNALELRKFKFNQKIEFVLLTGIPKESKKFNQIENKCLKLNRGNVSFIATPKISLKQLAKVFDKSHASLGFPGTYTTLGALASGRPFGAIIDTRKSEDRIFTDHVIGNAYFSRDVLNYPTVIIKDRIQKKHIDRLIDNSFIQLAFQKASGKKGTREEFLGSLEKWRDAFIYFIK